jgi:hypothetical protein
MLLFSIQRAIDEVSWCFRTTLQMWRLNVGSDSPLHEVETDQSNTGSKDC